MLKHEVVIFWSDEDDAYVAYAPELAGCMAHGETYRDALNNILDAMAFWIDTVREIGKSVPEPKGREVMFDLHASLAETTAPFAG